jgi:ubiquinone/menaquinone biosynthesis C-methylase UbiE
MDRIKEYLIEYDNPKILDIGSGKGDFIQLLDSVYQDYQEIIGIDIVDYVLEMDETAFSHNPKIKWMDKDVLDTIFPKESFDVISLSNTLHHMSDIKSLFDKMTSLLKPGGMIIVVEMFTSNDLTNEQVSHRILHSFSAKILREMNIVHSQISNLNCIIEAIEKNASLPIDQHWVLETKPYEEPVTIEYLSKLIDDLLIEVKDSPKYSSYYKEAQEIKKYLKENGLSLQKQVCVILKKAVS